MELCPKCGGELGDDGLCGICLLAGGYDTEAESDSDISKAVTQPAHASNGSLEYDGFGPYRILRAIGEGGMGVVYLAEQTHPIRRQVALKVVKPGMDTQQILSRFNYERQALALMDHPNIAQVYDADATEKGRPYFVMEYIDGLPITDYCDRHRLNTQERLQLILPICQALQHAHQKGILHRDIKPSNLLVKEQDGRPVPKIIDFGIAKATGQGIGVDTALTQFGQLVGTLEYISPEQADTVTSECDTGSDVYSLGVVIYELLVGAVPFDAASLRKAGLAELLRIIREEEAPSLPAKLNQMGQTATDLAAMRRTDPESLRRQLKDELNWIVMKAVEKNRERRYQSVSELAADIRRHLECQPVLVGPVSRLYRTRKFVSRHKLVVSSAMLVLTSLITGLISTAWQAHIAEGRRSEADLQRNRADAEAAAAREARASSEKSAQEAQLSAARALDSVANLRKAQADLQKSYEAQKRLALEARRKELVAEAAQSQTTDPALALYLGWQATRMGHPLPQQLQDIFATSLEAVPSYGSLRDNTSVGDLCWSPDGKILASTSDRVIRLWDAASGSALQTLSGDGNHLSSIAWSPNGKILASASSVGTIRLWDVTSGRAIRTLQDLSSVGWSIPSRIAWSPDGNTLAAATWTRNSPNPTILGRNGPSWVIQLWAAASGELLRTLRGHQNLVNSLVWSPDGRFVATASSDSTVLWDAASGTQAQTLIFEGSQVGAVSLAWSPDGSTVGGARGDSSTWLWETTSGRLLRIMPGHQDRVTSVTFSPDGKILTSAGVDQAIWLWGIRRGQRLGNLHGHSSTVTALAWSPDGRTLASASLDGAVRLWDTTNQEFNLDRPYASLIAWSPQGNALAYLDSNRTVKLWNPISRAPSVNLQGRQGTVVNLAWSPDDATLATAAINSAIRLWDAASGQLLRTVKEGDQNSVVFQSVAWSPDGRTIASSSGDHRIELWNVAGFATEEPQRTLVQEDGIRSLSWSRDGRILASAGFGVIRLWDTTTGSQFRTLSQRGMTTVAWSPDGRMLASVGDDRTAWLWDASSGRQIRSLQAEQSALHVVWRPDSKVVATSGSGGTILWDAVSGQALRTMRGVFGVNWSPDGRSLATLTSSGIRLEPGTLDVLLDDVRSAIRLFTPSPTECRQYFGSDICAPIQ